MNAGWIKYNLDDSGHVDIKKSTKQLQQSQPQAATVDNGSEIAVLAEQVKVLKETVNVLISQIQMLRYNMEGKCIRK